MFIPNTKLAQGTTLLFQLLVLPQHAFQHSQHERHATVQHLQGVNCFPHGAVQEKENIIVLKEVI